MKSKKADISMNTIVYAAIALFILVIIVGFASGAFGKLLGRLQPDAVEAAKDDCRIKCDLAKNAVSQHGWGEWEKSTYATKTYSVDTDNNKDTPDDLLHCWEPPVTYACSTLVRTADNKLLKCATPAEGKEFEDLEGVKCLEQTETEEA